MAPRPKITVREAQSYLRGHGFTVNSKDRSYLDRIVGNLRAQESAGLPLSLPAARGHAVTPEHPGRRRPVLPAPASRYTDIRRSKYRPMTQPLERAPRLVEPVTIESPAVHNRLGRPSAGMVLDTPNRKILITRSSNVAKRFIRDRERETPKGSTAQWRIGFDVFDCTTDREASIFRSPRGHRSTHSEGMTPATILDEMSERDMTLEQYLVRMQLDHYRPTSRMSHICEFVLYAQLWP